MKFTFLLTTVVHFLAVSSASATDDASPTVTLESNSSDGMKVAYPAVLADVADGRTSAVSADLALDLPDYCSDDYDYDCYKKGVPKCCVKQKVTCPSDRRPGCDIFRRRYNSTAIHPHEYCNASTDTCVRGYACLGGTCQLKRRRDDSAIRPHEYCNASTDTCVRGYACLGGTCQRTRTSIGYGGYCQAGIDTCVRGTSCIDGRCRRNTPVRIPADGYCRSGVDRCVRGYYCYDGKCSLSPYIKPGEVCQQGVDQCVRGYYCYDGKCSLSPYIRPGEVCQQDVDQCVSGHSCVNGRCSLSPYIRPGEVCQQGVDQCVSGYSCVNGRCVIPSISPGGVCSSGGVPCTAGYSCDFDGGTYRCVPRQRDVCRSGSDCGGGLVCTNGTCHAGVQWYTNWQYCVMDCPSSDGACCGGSAQSSDVPYGSAEACCDQSAFSGNHEGCLNKSLQCAREDYDDQLELVRSE